MQIDLFEVKEKVAIVTGDAGVLGSAIASGLAPVGVKVGLLGRTRDKVATKAEEIRSMGGEALPLVADVLQQTQLKAAREEVIFGEPEELTGTVIWLCSSAASFITGIVVPVDGGFSAFSGV